MTNSQQLNTQMVRLRTKVSPEQGGGLGSIMRLFFSTSLLASYA